MRGGLLGRPSPAPINCGHDATGCDEFEVYFVEVDFDKLADRQRRLKLKRLPTSYYLPIEEVDDLHAAARENFGNGGSDIVLGRS